MTQLAFNTEIKIGDKFLYNGKKNFLSEVVDILECTAISAATGAITTSTKYMAQDRMGLSTNLFEVSKSTIVRFRA